MSIAAAVRELETPLFPSESMESDLMNEDSPLDIDGHDLRKLPSTDVYDDGSVIDLLCLYTRQALITLCIDLKGNKCDEKYLYYENNMNLKCKMGVDQTVNAFDILNHQNNLHHACRILWVYFLITVILVLEYGIHI